MSLINDALKKTQKLQKQQPAAQAAPSAHVSAPTARQPGSGMSFERMLLLVVALVVVAVGVAAVAMLLTRNDNRRVVASVAHPVTSAPADASPVATPRPAAVEPTSLKVSTETSTPLSAVRPVVPTTPGISVAPTAAPQAPAIAITVPAVRPQATSAGVQPLPVPLPPAAAPAVSINLSPAPAPAGVGSTQPADARQAQPVPQPQQEEADKKTRILTFIDNARIGGVRLSGDDTKVLLNDHVYRLNSVVSMELGLKLTGVTATALTFADENGSVFTKSF